MIYISAQPAENYFAWQLAVQLENFKEVGIDLNNCHVLLARQGEIPDSIYELIGRYAQQGVQFFTYTDRLKRIYAPSVRFWLLDQHFNRFPELHDHPLFYHDSDIIFRELPDLSALTDKWYCADASSYLDVTYVTSKGKGLLENMCSIIGIDPIKVKYKNRHAGGVQYVINKVQQGFWKKCEIDSGKLYAFLHKSEPLYRYLYALTTGNKDYHPIQAWCSDMWVIWLNTIVSGIDFEIHDLLRFTWATDPIEKWETAYIFHNAGVSDKTPYLFNKGHYKDTPPKEITTSSDHCSWYYVELIKQTLCL